MVWRNANLVLRVAEREESLKKTSNFLGYYIQEFLLVLNDTYAVTDLNVLNVDTFHKIRASSVGRASVL